MGKVVFDITVTLDGFVAGPNDSPELPMGEGGMRLFDHLGPEKSNGNVHSRTILKRSFI